MKSVIDTAQNTVPYLGLLHASGVRTVIRYYNHQNTDTHPQKQLELDEAHALADAGFDLAVVFEQRGGNARHIGDLDAKHGRRDAEQALALAKGIQQPTGSAIYFAVDDDYFHKEALDVIEGYFREVRALMDGEYRVGVYGSGTVAARMLDKGLADLAWLAAGRKWAGTDEFLKSDRWALFQSETERHEGHLSYDSNDVSPTFPDFGQFRVPTKLTPQPAALTFSAPLAVPVLMQVRARSGLKLRPTPGVEQPPLQTIDNGVIVTALSQSGEWVKVDLNGDGTADGFMHADFLEPLTGGFPLIPPVGATPLDIARQELALGVAELPGPGNNPRILLYHSHTSSKATKDSIPWCSSFVNYCVDMAGLVGTHSSSARSWRDWGHAVTGEPREGDIVVFRRTGPGVSEGSGHVGFWLGATDLRISVLGGNQSDRVKISIYPQDGPVGEYHYELLSVRRP